ncbi:MAG: DUF1565 domain-containing protein [Cyanobacteria bacterium P01_A01_bin.135]
MINLALVRRSLALSCGLAVALVARPAVAQVPLEPGTPQTPIPQAPAAATTLYVDPTAGTDAEAGGSQAQPLRTISYALQQASASSSNITVIQLQPGRYSAESGETFPLALRPGIVLQGDEATQGESVQVVGGGEFVTGMMGRQNATIVASDDSEIRGLTIANPNTRGSGVWVESVNPIDPLIRGNTFTQNNRDGVFINGIAVPVVERNRFIENGDNGISLTRRAGGEIRNNEFINTGFAIVVSDSASPTITDNQIRENLDGVVSTTRSQPVLRGNVITDNRRDGVVAIGNASPDMGTAQDPGLNMSLNNGRFDIHNGTRSNVLAAVGNQSDEGQIEGEVDFVARVIGFPDVQGHWAQAYIEALAAQEIVGGFPDSTYRPNEPVTRAQFAAIINKAFAQPAKRSPLDFTDVQSDFWGYSAIRSAYLQGFLSGYPGQVFLPSREIPRLEVLVSLASGLELTEAAPTALSKYQDAAAIPSWATGAIAAATEADLVVNYPAVEQLNPGQQATRADVAAFVYQALVQAGRAQPVDSQYLVR